MVWCVVLPPQPTHADTLAYQGVIGARATTNSCSGRTPNKPQPEVQINVHSERLKTQRLESMIVFPISFDWPKLTVPSFGLEVRERA